MMEAYFKELIIAAVISGVVSLLGDKLRGGFGKLISLLCALVMIFYLISPLISFFSNDNALDDITAAGNITIPCVTESGDILLAKTKEILRDSATALTEREFSLDESDISIEFTISEENGAVIIDEIMLTVKSIKALSLRDEIADFLFGKYSVKCSFTEEISF